MAINSTGYDGSVDESQWAKLAPDLGATYTVEYQNDLRPTIGPGTRQVILDPGVAAGYGVRDFATEGASVTLGAVSSGSRWDLIVLRRNWNGTGGTSTFRAIQGAASRQLPANGTGEVGDPDANTLQHDPGYVDDQPIALARVSAGSSTIAELIDLRVWTQNGGSYANDKLVLSYLDRVGTQICIDNVLWQRGVDVSGNAKWIALTAPIEHHRTGAAVTGINLVSPGTTGLPIFKSGQVTDSGREIRFGNQYLAKVTFTTAFPNGIMSLQVTPIEVASGAVQPTAGAQPFVVDEVSKTGFSVMVPDTAVLSTRSYMWLAVGY